MLHDPEFWVLLGSALFIVAVWKPAARAIAGNLDSRGAKIKAQLDEAAVLRREAETLLAETDKRKAEAVAEAQRIRQAAEAEAKRLAAEAAESLKALAQRREQAALDKIAEAEAAALAEVRRTAVAVAVAATRAILERQVPGAIGARLVDQAIDELPGRLTQAA